ncbi:Protochlorophyllide reductase, chloroplastic [Gossypium arboreum]|uniref:Protochlorophyllide reductase, chloroplastic n=1 Tax=Gossypium arboreum TaxID=29729 RepID=A0A0B0M7I1_GOSAR|nr:Protochlorophyllide reductase, chloroplastic [Gossypium arboreum]
MALQTAALVLANFTLPKRGKIKSIFHGLYFLWGLTF